MKELIKSKIPIHLDLAPNRDEVYSGICLKSNDKIFILISFNDETLEFDGYLIIRSYEIEKYREWDKEELNEIKNNSFSKFLNRLQLDKMNNMFECLSELKTKKLISVFIESDDDSFFLGQIVKINGNDLELRLLSEDAEWIGKENIKINEITYIGFDTSFEKNFERSIE